MRAATRIADRQLPAERVFTIEPGVYISTALLDMLPDTPKNRAFIAKVRPVVERYNHTGVRIEDDYLVSRKGWSGSRRRRGRSRGSEAVMAGR